MKEILKNLSAPLAIFGVILGLTYLVSGALTDNNEDDFNEVAIEQQQQQQQQENAKRSPTATKNKNKLKKKKPSLTLNRSQPDFNRNADPEEDNNDRGGSYKDVADNSSYTPPPPRNENKKPEATTEIADDKKEEKKKENTGETSSEEDEVVAVGGSGETETTTTEETTEEGSSEDDDDEESTPAAACSISHDKATGDYKEDLIVTLNPGSDNAYYCVDSSVCGSSTCDPLTGTNNVSAAVGATDGPYCLRYQCTNSDGISNTETAVDYNVDENLPDLNVDGPAIRYLQTTEYFSNLSITSNDFGKANFEYYQVNVPWGTAPDPTTITDCALDSNQTPETTGLDLVYTYLFSGYGMDMNDDATVDSNDVITMLAYAPGSNQFPGSIRGKDSFNYSTNPTDYNEVISIMLDRNALDLERYACQRTYVKLEDFDYFQTTTSGNVPVNGSGEMELSGTFNAYQGGTFTTGSSTDPVLEVSLSNITN